MMLPPFKVDCHCSQCQGYLLSMFNYVKNYGSYPYSDTLVPVWAQQPLCSGSCGTHGECGSCPHCDESECDCQCEKCDCGALLGECDCCSSCGSAYCGWCDRCDEPSCNCGGHYSSDADLRFGSIKTAPWVDRGVQVESAGYMSSESIRQAWGIDASIDVCQAAADFYLLEALAGAGGGVYTEAMANSDSVLSFHRWEAQQMLAELTARLDKTFQGYLDMIIGGELRHHRSARTSTLRGDRKEAWGEWHAIRTAAGESALSDAVDLFEDFNSSSYGGAAWANIARLLLARKTGGRHGSWPANMTARTFVDRVWTLEHNGGSLFDKGSWGVVNGMGWHYGMLKQYVLPAHGATNPFPVLLLVASPEVRELFETTWRQCNRVRLALGQKAKPVRRAPVQQSYYGERYLDYTELVRLDMIGTVHA